MKFLTSVIVAAGIAAAHTDLASPASLAAANDRSPPSVIEDIWNKLKQTSTCNGCHALIGALKGIALLGDDAFVKISTGVCKVSQKVDDDVCEGVLKIEGPILARVLRDMTASSREATLLCSNLIGLCPYPQVDTWNVPFPSLKPANSPRPVPSGKKPLKIVHFSDTHVDPLYTVGASTNCTKNICCRPYTAAEAPGNNDSPAGPWGDYKCDAPVGLEQSAFDAIKALVPDAAFGIFTGDIVDHAIWNTSQSYNIQQINDLYRRANNAVKVLYATAGNHEAHPANAFPTIAQGNGIKWLYDLLAAKWSPWIGGGSAATTAQFGAFSTKFAGGKLRIISLNTNMFYTFNFWLYESPMERDPSGQLAWLVKELDDAEKAGERAYIIGHIPPGQPDAFHDMSNYLDQVVKRYDNTIAAMFFGHTHMDEFQVSYRDYNRRDAQNAMAVSWIMPSITPTSGNPTFRVYSVDPDTFAVIDSVTYQADMRAPGYQTKGPTWTKYYSAREVYGPLVNPPLPAGAEMGPAFWHNVTVAFEKNPAALMAYLNRKTRDYQPASCNDATCVADTICMLRGGRAENNCYQPRILLNAQQDAGASIMKANDVHGRECGNSVAMTVLQATAQNKGLLSKLITSGADAGASYNEVV